MALANAIEKTLGADEKISFTEEWNYKDLTLGNKVPAGKYTVTVRILAMSDQVELKAED